MGEVHDSRKATCSIVRLMHSDVFNLLVVTVLQSAGQCWRMAATLPGHRYSTLKAVHSASNFALRSPADAIAVCGWCCF